MRIADITAEALAEVNDKELLSLHRRCHQLAGSLFATARERAEDDDEGKLTWEDLVNAHALIAAEMEAREMNHNVRDKLDRESAKVEKSAVSLEYLKARLAEAQDVVVVENFISIAGSVIQKGDRAGDVDLVIRQDRRDPGLEILTRKVFDPEKRGYLHWIYQESGPHADYVPAFDLVLRPKKEFKVHTVKARLRPVTRYMPSKPAMIGYSEFFSADELWEKWAKGQDVALYVSPKVDGFRCIMQKSGDRVSIYFEDSKEERADELPNLREALLKAPDCIIEGELQAAKDGKFLARPQVFSVLAGQLEAQPYVFLYDLLYVEPEGDVHEKPFSERYELLKSLGKKLGGNFVVLPQLLVKDEGEFKRAAKEMASWQPFRGADLAIEGVVARRSDMPYTFGATDNYCLPAGTPVWANGLVLPIEVVQPGTDLGERTVLATSGRLASELVSIKTPLLPAILATPEHRFEVFKGFRIWRRRLRQREAYYRNRQPKPEERKRRSSPRVHHLPVPDFEFVRADMLSPEDGLVVRVPRVTVPLPAGERFSDPDFYEFLGWYVAEGSCRPATSIRLGRHGADTVERLANIARRHFAHVHVNHNEKTHSVTWSDGPGGQVAKWFREQFGEASWSKQLPPWLYAAPKECLERFLEGYWAGDGHKTRKGFAMAATASWELAWQLWFLLLHLGRVAGIRRYHRGKKTRRPQWNVWFQERIGRNRSWMALGNGVYVLPINAVGREIGTRPVFHLETSDERFLCPVSSHNSKFKLWVELKVKVLAVEKTANGYVYECALRDDKTGEDVSLGKTFVSKEKLADEGDTLNVMIEELLLYPDGKVAWGKPYPMGPDRSRPAYTVAQAIDIARRGKVLKVIHEGIANKASGTDEERVEASYVRRLRAAGYEVGDGHSVHKVGDSDKGSIYRVNDGYGEWYFLAASERVHFLCVKMADVGAFSAGKLLKGVLTKERVKELGWDTDTWDRALLAWLRGKGEETKKAVPADEGETRGERAENFWKENWDKLYPKSGKGRFVLHEHWRGLSEDEVNLPREELIRRGHSLHSDLRLESNGTLHGWTVFLGKAEDNATNRLISLPPDDNLQVAPKLAQPTGWLTFEGVSEPGEVGATTGRYARFDIVDSGTYEAGVWREHMMEYFFHGKKLKGRLLVQYAPLGGRRVWIIDRPEDQRPYAETHDLEDVVRELKDKGQKWLIWRKPGEKPRLIDVGAFELKKASASRIVPIAKVDSARQIVYGIVLDPYIVDSQGDWVPVLEVEKAAHRYLVKSRTIGDQHKKKADAELVESWLVPYPTPEDYRKAIAGESHKVYQFKFGESEVHSGAWVIGIHVLSERLWQEVQSGAKTGLSIGAVGERTRNVAQVLPQFEVVEPEEIPVFVAAK